jgi:cell division protease FtsH
MIIRGKRVPFVFLLLMAGVVLAGIVLRPSSGEPDRKDLSAVIAEVQAGQVEKIVVSGSTAEVTRTDQSKYRSRLEPDTSLYLVLSRSVTPAQLSAIAVEVKAKGTSIWSYVVYLLPILILVGLLIFFMRRMQGGGSQITAFGKSKARRWTSEQSTGRFDDVAGLEESKAELQEVVEFLRTPEKFAALGAKIPRGVLLVGPPGTGKTLIARAVAGEAGVPFFSISGSEFVEMFVGVGASRVRDLFTEAKRTAPCIIFIDEIDAVGRQRGAGLGNSNDEREQTLNQILVEMDGFDTNTNVMIIAATNRPDILDAALLRPGRFDRQVLIDAPDSKGRKAILEVHTNGKPLEKDVSLESIAKRTPGFSGADLANLVNEAAIMAARLNKKSIGIPQFEEAVDRVMLGPERKSRVRSAKENRMVAFHESGHALVAHMLEGFDPLFKVSIVSRGMTGGYTAVLPDEELSLNTRSHLEKMLAMMLGGHSAEVEIFGEMSTGASDDIGRATRVARAMVTRFGMSERLGPRTFGRSGEAVFLGRQVAEQRDYSEKIAMEIDEEVRRIIEKAHEHARTIISDNRIKLTQLATTLLDVEVLEGEALRELMALDAGTIPPPDESAEQTA